MERQSTVSRGNRLDKGARPRRWKTHTVRASSSSDFPNHRWMWVREDSESCSNGLESDHGVEILTLRHSESLQVSEQNIT